jgi:hypothetical protein
MIDNTSVLTGFFDDLRHFHRSLTHYLVVSVPDRENQVWWRCAVLDCLTAL